MLDRVLDHIRHGLVEEDRVEIDGRRVELDLQRAIGEAGAQPLQRPTHQIVELENVPLGAQGAGLDAAEIEEIRDEVVQVLHLTIDGVRARLLVLGRQAAPGPEGARRRTDRREGRPQVVRDGLEQGRLERVALTRDLGRLGLGREAVVRERLPELIGDGGEEARLRRIGLAPGPWSSGPDGPEHCIPCRDADAERLEARALAGVQQRPVDANPSDRTLVRKAVEDGVQGTRTGGSGPGVGRDALVRVVRSQRDPHPLHGRGGTQRSGDCREDLVGGVPRRELAAHPEQVPRLPLPRDRDPGPRPLQCGQVAHHDRHEHEQDEAEPLARVADGERVIGLGEEEVVDEEGPDRRDEGARRSRHDRRDDDRRHVDHRRVRDADKPLQRPHRTGGHRERHGRGAQQNGDLRDVNPAHAADATCRSSSPGRRHSSPACSDGGAADPLGRRVLGVSDQASRRAGRR